MSLGSAIVHVLLVSLLSMFKVGWLKQPFIHCSLDPNKAQIFRLDGNQVPLIINGHPCFSVVYFSMITVLTLKPVARP